MATGSLYLGPPWTTRCPTATGRLAANLPPQKVDKLVERRGHVGHFVARPCLIYQYFPARALANSRGRAPMPSI